MHSHQLPVDPRKFQRQANRQHHHPAQKRMTAQSALQNRKQQVQQQQRTQKPFSYTGKALTHPSGRDRKAVQSKNGKQKAPCGRGGIIAGARDKPRRKTENPRQPEHGIQCPRPLYVKVLCRGIRWHGIAQRCTGHHEKQGGTKIPQIDAQRQCAGEQFMGQSEIARHRGIEMYHQNTPQRHSANQIQIKQSLGLCDHSFLFPVSRTSRASCFATTAGRFAARAHTASISLWAAAAYSGVKVTVV